MAFLSIPNVKIAGIAAAVPEIVKEVRNLPFFAPGEAEKVINLTKIERSRIAPEGVCCSDLCYASADRLIESLKWNRSEIDALVYVSLSRDYVTPHTSAILQDRLGLSQECYAIDVPLACSGYVYGLSVISSLITTGSIRKALLLVGETTSMLQSLLDKTIWPLHGDAGSATALEFDSDSKPIMMHLATDGSRWDAIINPDGGVRHPITEDSLVMREVEPGVFRNRTHAILDGMGVFGFSIKEPPKSIKMLCDHFNINIEDVDFYLLHQANKYLDEKIARKLKLPLEKVPYSLTQYGNTSSCTIPLTIVTELAKENISERNVNCIMCGFGSGLSWASAYVQLDRIVCCPLIEYVIK